MMLASVFVKLKKPKAAILDADTALQVEIFGSYHAIIYLTESLVVML